MAGVLVFGVVGGAATPALADRSGRDLELEFRFEGEFVQVKHGPSELALRASAESTESVRVMVGKLPDDTTVKVTVQYALPLDYQTVEAAIVEGPELVIESGGVTELSTVVAPELDQAKLEPQIAWMTHEGQVYVSTPPDVTIEEAWVDDAPLTSTSKSPREATIRTPTGGRDMHVSMQLSDGTPALVYIPLKTEKILDRLDARLHMDEKGARVLNTAAATQANGFVFTYETFIPDGKIALPKVAGVSVCDI